MKLFSRAVSVAGMILENKFDRYRGNERADKRVEEIYERHMRQFHDREKHSEDAKIHDSAGVCTVSEIPF